MIRGQVVTSLGLGLMGVRVSTKNKLEGFTFTRDDGWFDLLVNGGGSVTLVFSRVPFGTKSHVVNVPWNEIVVVDRVILVSLEFVLKSIKKSKLAFLKKKIWTNHQKVQ